MLHTVFDNLLKSIYMMMIIIIKLSDYCQLKDENVYAFC